MTDLLAIAAHPDDVELAASGTMLVHARLGYKTAVVDLTRGELGSRGTPELRDEEAAASAIILGLSGRMNLGLKDGFFESDEQSLLKLVAAIRHFRPKVVLANSVTDRHPDHGRGGSFVSRACFLAGLPKINTSFEGATQQAHRPVAVYHYIQDRYIIPDLVVDITEVFEERMQSIRAFKSQFFDEGSAEPVTPISGKDYFDFLEGRARDFGRLIGVKYGEGFTVERAAGVTDLFQLK